MPFPSLLLSVIFYSYFSLIYFFAYFFLHLYFRLCWYSLPSFSRVFSTIQGTAISTYVLNLSVCWFINFCTYILSFILRAFWCCLLSLFFECSPPHRVVRYIPLKSPINLFVNFFITSICLFLMTLWTLSSSLPLRFSLECSAPIWIPLSPPSGAYILLSFIP